MASLSEGGIKVIKYKRSCLQYQGRHCGISTVVKNPATESGHPLLNLTVNQSYIQCNLWQEVT